MIVLPDILKNTYSACIAATTVGATSRKVPTGVHVFIQSTCSVWQMMHRIVSFKHVFVLHKPMCFTREIQHETVCFMKIIPFELARIPMFAMENDTNTLCFRAKMTLWFRRDLASPATLQIQVTLRL